MLKKIIIAGMLIVGMVSASDSLGFDMEKLRESVEPVTIHGLFDDIVSNALINQYARTKVQLDDEFFTKYSQYIVEKNESFSQTSSGLYNKHTHYIMMFDDEKHMSLDLSNNILNMFYFIDIPVK